jgi:NAD(P)-dependent dehydrogenase (short-subunit alcohol dehydrogenase family)
VVPSFIKAGVKGLVLLAMNEKKLAETEAEINQNSPNVATLALALDISDAAAVDAAFSKVKDVFGHADVLVNCAGVCSGDGPDVADAEPDLWWRNFVRDLRVRIAFNQVLMGVSRRSMGKGPFCLCGPSFICSRAKTRGRHLLTLALGMRLSMTVLSCFRLKTSPVALTRLL